MRTLDCVVVMALLSGCLSGAHEPWGPYTFPTPQSFTARASEGRTITFTGPVTIADADGSPFAAYALKVAWTEDGHPEWYVWYLDSNMRLVSVETRCGNLQGGCEHYAQWDWQDKGAVSPSGIGWPDLIKRNEFRSYAHRVTENLGADIQFEKDGTLRVVADWVPFTDKTYRYHPGQMLAEDPRWFRGFSYEAGANMSGAATIPGPAPHPEARPWQGILFPGEDQDAFGRGFTHRDFATFAFPELGDPASNVCAISYSIAIYDAPPPMVPQTEVLMPATRTASATVYVIRNGGLEWSQVETWRENGQNSMRHAGSNRVDGVDLAGIDCEQVRASPWPILNTTQGLDFARGILRHGSGMARFDHTVYRIVTDATGSHLDGGIPDWRFAFIPDWVTPSTGFYSEYEVYFEPIQGLPLKFIVAEPSDNLIR